MVKEPVDAGTHNYDVCLSFAGEDRKYVEALARMLQTAGVRTFYDEFEKTSLWGKDLYTHLHDIYQNQASYCVMFISKHYVEKAWTAHERRSAQSRAFTSDIEYLLPVRFDNTEVPGLPSTIGFIDVRDTAPKELCELIKQKIGPRPRCNYFPPVPDRLFKEVKANSNKKKELVYFVSHKFFQCLSRMTSEERLLVYDVFMNCCPAELPENVHIELDYLRRITGMRPAKIKRLSSGIQSLGFDQTIRIGHSGGAEKDDTNPVLVLEWHNRAILYSGNYTGLADILIKCVAEHYCDEHARMMFERLDFGQLSTSTTTVDDH